MEGKLPTGWPDIAFGSSARAVLALCVSECNFKRMTFIFIHTRNPCGLEADKPWPRERS